MGYNATSKVDSCDNCYPLILKDGIFIHMKTVIYILAVLLFTCTLSLQAQQRPNLCASKEAHQFDFWLGDWDVYDTNADTIVGHNLITPLANGCALLENWSSTSGFTGSSINKYNFATKMWEQMWVDVSGNTLHIKGTYKDSKMILENEQPGQGGNGTVKNKITYYNNSDGTVRQHWEFSNDQGKTWQSAFDGMYRKVKK